MARIISPYAGKPARMEMLVDVPKLVSAYYTGIPDPTNLKQCVVFGTSGHRGCSFKTSFNEWHILAITQAICLYRVKHKITGPLFIGFDTHALSAPAFASALEVLAANEVDVMISEHNEFTPTPVISHAILVYNHDRTNAFADGIVITPSHNPPQDGGFKYNPPSGGPANLNTTEWIERKANQFIKQQLKGVKRVGFEKALKADTTHRYDYLNAYIKELGQVVDMDLIRSSDIHMGVDPMGGAGVHYWKLIAQYYDLNLTVVNDKVDPTFHFMTLDWDGQIRMDPSSPYAMVNLVSQKNQFDLAFACDTDHDRHGIVSKIAGLIPPNHYLSVAIEYLFNHRPNWAKSASVGKTIVSSQMIDRVTAKVGRRVEELPVGFKWFVDGLHDGRLAFCGEESAGASFSRMSGLVWTTDKDGFIPCLLAAEITANQGLDVSEVYQALDQELGPTFYELNEVSATDEKKQILKSLSPELIKSTELAGEKINNVITTAPGNGASFGGLKIMSQGGWFAVRPSGTEDIYKIYAESFYSQDHLNHIISEAEMIVKALLPRFIS